MRTLYWFLLGLGSLLVACRSSAPAELSLMTHDSFAVSEEIIAQFEADHNITVQLLPSGDAGAALNQAILAREAPLADVFFGVDNTFMGRALDAGIFEAYQPAALADVPASLQLDDSHRLTPIDYGDVCLNYDIAWFAEHGLQPPGSLADLTDPAYAGLLVVEDPGTSSPGLAFLLATVSTFGTEGDYTYLDYWEELRANDVLVTAGWEEAYWGQFSAASDGQRPLVVSYASSPPAEVYYGELEEAPTASIIAPGSCFRQVEFAGILQGTKQGKLARQFIDYMLSLPFQEDIPLNMFVFPANRQAALPELFTRWAEVPAQPATLAPELIAANRDAWIEAWSEVVLR